VTEPTSDAVPAVRRAGRWTGALAAVALLAALVVFLAGGPPYATDIAGIVLYVLGLCAGLVAGVLLWASWTEGGPPTGPTARRGVAAAALALLLVCVCGVVSLGRVAPGSVQLVLMALTALALATAVLAAPRSA
jgi:peptidoglycan/LPS O-acetylase OafA/YrhL